MIRRIRWSPILIAYPVLFACAIVGALISRDLASLGTSLTVGGLAVFASATVWVLLVALLAAAIAKPLTPLSDTSILWRRAAALWRRGITIAAFFGGALWTWSMTASPVSADPAPIQAVVANAAELLIGLVVVTAVFVWAGLVVDLFRLGSRGRRNAVDWWIHRFSPSPSRTLLRAACQASVADKLDIVAGFVLAPGFLLLLVLLGMEIAPTLWST